MPSFHVCEPIKGEALGKARAGPSGWFSLFRPFFGQAELKSLLINEHTLGRFDGLPPSSEDHPAPGWLTKAVLIRRVS